MNITRLLLIVLFLSSAVPVNAGLLLDDFSAGDLSFELPPQPENGELEVLQTDLSIPGGSRDFEMGTIFYDEGVQGTSSIAVNTNEGRLIAVSDFKAEGFEIGFGSEQTLALDLTQAGFEAIRIDVANFENPDPTLFKTSIFVQARSGKGRDTVIAIGRQENVVLGEPHVVTLPFSEFAIPDERFSFESVDELRIGVSGIGRGFQLELDRIEIVPEPGIAIWIPILLVAAFSSTRTEKDRRSELHQLSHFQLTNRDA